MELELMWLLSGAVAVLAGALAGFIVAYVWLGKDLGPAVPVLPRPDLPPPAPNFVPDEWVSEGAR